MDDPTELPLDALKSLHFRRSAWAWQAAELLPAKFPAIGSEAEGPPVKKQKFAPATKTLSSIIKLTVAPNQQSVVTVSDDKCLRVFTVEGDGKVAELSQRFMPKRPCAVVILPDDESILCGDKFGDVYSLPLFGQAGDKELAMTDAHQEGTAVETTFKPQATNLTVHTKRNRKALEAQMKQKNRTPKSKEPLRFELELLLGHVSMLTDLAFVAHTVGEKQRRYIITADRDEHIRFSRAPPQAHIIEGYCLGHTEFVNKVCAVPNTDLLVSGGGDDWLGVWQWPSFSLRRKLNIKNVLSQYTSKPVAISGIWAVPDVGDEGNAMVLVACERVPVLFSISVQSLLQENSALEALPLAHPPLDVAAFHKEILVSLDSRVMGESRLVPAQVGQSMNPGLEDKLKQLATKSSETDDKTLDSLFYGVANLRKRTGWGTLEQDDAPDDHDVPEDQD
nr:trna (guanine-n(7)-)-methyltransferase non-catalytic subunit trm82 [Quercus suber]